MSRFYSAGEEEGLLLSRKKKVGYST